MNYNIKPLIWEKDKFDDYFASVTYCSGYGVNDVYVKYYVSKFTDGKFHACSSNTIEIDWHKEFDTAKLAQEYVQEIHSEVIRKFISDLFKYIEVID